MQFAVVEPGKPIVVKAITPEMLRQITEQYRVAQVFIPSEMVNPPIPPALLAQLYNFGNPLLPQTSSFRSLDETSYIYQVSLPTIQNSTLSTIHNTRR